MVGEKLDEDLPFNDYIQYFGPEYKLEVPQTSMDNLNTREYLDNLRTKIIDNLRNLPSAPGVQMQETPRTTLNPADVEMSDDEDSDLDERISQRLRDAHTQKWDDELSGDEGEEEDQSAWAMATSRRSSTASNGRRRPGIMDPIKPFEHDLGLKYISQNGAGAAKGKGRAKRTFFASRAAKPVLADLHFDEDDEDDEDDHQHHHSNHRTSGRSVRTRGLGMGDSSGMAGDSTPLSDVEMGSPALSAAVVATNGNGRAAANGRR